VRAGAFDFLDDGAGVHRASLLASVGVALEAAGQAERNAMQTSLFGGDQDRSTGPRSSPRPAGPMRSACARKRPRSASISPATPSPSIAPRSANS